jgi:hypothetical protein
VGTNNRPIKKCEICDTDVYQKNWKRHIQTKKHKDREKHGPDVPPEQKITDTFCITINNKCDKYKLFDYLLEGCEYQTFKIDVTECVIGREYGVSGINEHFHVYLKVLQKVEYIHVLSWIRGYGEVNYIEEVGETDTPIGTTYPINSVLLETCKKRKDWIKYCTKEDNEPLTFNVDLDLLHKNAKQYMYIKFCAKWDIENYVVKSTIWTDIKQFRIRHSQYWGDIRRANAVNSAVMYSCDHLLEHMNSTNKKGMVLFGEAGRGKTSTALTYMGTDYYTILPTSNFMLNSYAQQKHIFIDDVSGDKLQHMRDICLKATANQSSVFQGEIKGGEIIDFTLEGKLIITSNADITKHPTWGPEWSRRFEIFDCDDIEGDNHVCTL